MKPVKLQLIFEKLCTHWTLQEIWMWIYNIFTEKVEYLGFCESSNQTHDQQDEL